MDRRIFKSQRKGNDSGQIFTTEVASLDLQSAVLTHITVGAGTQSNTIFFLEVKYHDRARPDCHSARYGSSTSCTTYDITLDSSEWIVRVEGSWVSTFNNIAFISNKGKTYGPYGGSRNSTSFTLEPSEPGFGLLWMNGYWNESGGISSLQATFATYPPNLETASESPAFLKYEDGNTSAFLRQLQSPSVTLLVGTPTIALTVPDHVLCTLPYFRAALHGEFLEASSKTIKMPEDDAAIIAAFIEYMTHGFYTYASTHRSSQPDLEQGLFHLKLYAAAMKYDYKPLRKSAMESLQFVLKHLHGLDAIKVWQDLYACGLTIDDLKTLRPNKVRLIMKELYTENPTSIAAIFEETPALPIDMLRLMIMTE